MGNRSINSAPGETGRSEHATAAAAYELCDLATGHRQNSRHLKRPSIWEELAAKLLEGAAFPQKAKADALHIAIATVHGMDYLLMSNCTHIADAIMRPRIESICRSAGYEPPVICTPPELRSSNTMWCDPIVEEIHRIREQQAKALGDGLHGICEEVRKRQATSGSKLVTRSSRKPGVPNAA